MDIVRGAGLEKQVRVRSGSLAVFANARVLLATGTSRLASQIKSRKEIKAKEV